MLGEFGRRPLCSMCKQQSSSLRFWGTYAPLGASLGAQAKARWLNLAKTHLPGMVRRLVGWISLWEFGSCVRGDGLKGVWDSETAQCGTGLDFFFPTTDYSRFAVCSFSMSSSLVLIVLKAAPGVSPLWSSGWS